MHHRIAPEEIAPTNHGPNIIMFGPSETHHQSKITNNLLDSLFQWWTWHNRHHIGDVNEWMSKCRVCSLKPLLIIIIICVFLLFHHPDITVLSQPYSPVDFDLKRLQSYVLFCSVLFCSVLFCSVGKKEEIEYLKMKSLNQSLLYSQVMWCYDQTTGVKCNVFMSHSFILIIKK